MKQLADKYKIREGAIYKVLRGITWRLAPGPIIDKSISLFRYGERMKHHKLTADNVREIRRLHPSQSFKALGRQFHVSDQTIKGIVRRHYWKHIV